MLRTHISVCVHISRCCLLLSVVVGCNRGPALPPTTPVSGTVTLDGKPLEGATVMFVPKDREKGTAANGKTDAAGKFELTTFVAGSTQAKGALAGDYVVTVAKSEAQAIPAPQYGAESPTPVTTGVGTDKGPTAGKELVPKKYGNANETEFKATVPGGPFTFDLKSE
ncbi:MAG TPA: DUF6795 domain-containing protein [Pirellulales bacterium]|nr:DUF6795 domain-containing protein [Pirellulales bacterium]